MSTVNYEAGDGVAVVTLDRPDSLNALDAALGADLLAALKTASGDAAVRAVVLTGAGRGFCAGGDLKAMAAGLTAAAGGAAPYEMGAILRHFHEVVEYLFAMEKPVVAALHGPAVGAGMSLALACDFRIAAEDVTFSQAFIRIGLTPDGGSTWLLPRMLGPARAAQLAMTGETIGADRALAWGLLNEVTAPGRHLERAREVARGLAAASPQAMRSLKQLLRSSETNSFAAQLGAEASAQSANGATPEFRAALQTFLTRKAR